MSARATQEISEEERRYEDGTDPKVLDIIEIEMTRPEPRHHQQENHVIDDEYSWIKRGMMTWSELTPAIQEMPGPLWLNGYSSTYGKNDRVPEHRLIDLSESLYLVRPDQLTLVVASEGGDFSPARRRVRARFTLSNSSYCFVVTDPLIEREQLAKENAATTLHDALICVSLTEVFRGFAYKLVAAVITPQRAKT